MPDAKLAGGGHFLPGSKVAAFVRTGDFFPGAGAVGDPVKSTTVTDSSEVVFKGLDEGRYWAVGEAGAHVAFTAKPSSPVKERQKASGSFDAQAVPRVRPGLVITQGATGTKVAGRTVETPLPRHVDEAQPHLNMASVGKAVPLRSATPLGEALPTDPGEPQPKPTQGQVKANVKQMSSTPFGEATPIVEDSGPQPQEDASKRLKQRSDTPEGEQTPVGSAEPRGTAVNPDSREQAAGVRSTAVKPKGSGKKAARPAVADKLKK